MIILVGESGSGKSSIEEVLIEKYGFEKVITCTTRPMRPGEIDGMNYHFLSPHDFSEKIRNDEFAEYAVYRDRCYGTLKQDCFGEKKVLVCTPHGLRNMRKILGENGVTSFYIKVERRDRLIKLLQRGDDIEEAYSTSLSDVGMFDGIADEADYTMLNPHYEYSPETMAKAIVDLMNSDIITCDESEVDVCDEE